MFSPLFPFKRFAGEMYVRVVVWGQVVMLSGYEKSLIYLMDLSWLGWQVQHPENLQPDYHHLTPLVSFVGNFVMKKPIFFFFFLETSPGHAIMKPRNCKHKEGKNKTSAQIGLCVFETF